MVDRWIGPSSRVYSKFNFMFTSVFAIVMNRKSQLKRFIALTNEELKSYAWCCDSELFVLLLGRRTILLSCQTIAYLQKRSENWDILAIFDFGQSFYFMEYCLISQKYFLQGWGRYKSDVVKSGGHYKRSQLYFFWVNIFQCPRPHGDIISWLNENGVSSVSLFFSTRFFSLSSNVARSLCTLFSILFLLH